jgi:hypothetical protein
MKNSPKGVGAVVLAAIAVSTFHAEAGAVPADAHFRSSCLVLNAHTSDTASPPFAHDLDSSLIVPLAPTRSRRYPRARHASTQCPREAHHPTRRSA